MSLLPNISEDIQCCCGLGTVCYYGPDPTGALDTLLRNNFDAYAYTSSSELAAETGRYFPGRCFCMDFSAAMQTTADRKTDILLIDSLIESLPLVELMPLLSALRKARAIVLLLSAVEVDGVRRDCEWWEARCIDAGMRRHPRVLHLVPYHERNNAPDSFAVYMESIPEEALAAYPLENLKTERDLHMDMLREAGRRSDAHIVRYHMAAQFVRPGDTILDCACGLGYGSYMLFHNSPAQSVFGVDLSESSIRYATKNYGLPGYIRYQQGDAHNLSTLPDNSIDFITSFETLEHLPHPKQYLKELARVLRPSGRIMMSVPNEWPVDPANARPPYHCHEYTWDRFRGELSEHFLLDRGFAQTAGGGGRCPDSPRALRDIAIDAPLDEDCEWIILLCTVDPRSGKELPFVETTHTSQPDHPDYHATAYEKSYINPWLAKGLTTWPMYNGKQRSRLSEKVMEEYPPSSADYGAALCVLAYRQLENRTESGVVANTLHRIGEYLKYADTRPHCVRWKISLCYVGALLYQKIGDVDQAEKWFLACSEMNPAAFSAMSGTKTTDSLYRAALYALGRNEKETALERLRKAVEIGQTLVQGEWFNICGDIKMPVTFGMHDLTQIMENLTRCTYALHQVETWHDRPALALSQSHGLFEVTIKALQNQANTQQKCIKSLLDYVEYLKNSLNDSLSEKEQYLIQNQQLVEYYEQSRSWKMTAPLRKIVKILRSIKPYINN